MDLLVYKVVELQHIHHADRHILCEHFTCHSVVQREFVVFRMLAKLE